MLVNVKEILKEAKNKKYAVPHFNINNLEWTKFILEECEKNNSPVILGVSESAIHYMGGYNVVYGIVISLIQDLSIGIPVVLHLDHGTSIESCKKAMDAGFTSVMIDASKYSLEENSKITKEVVAYAKIKNASVEAEVGTIGSKETGLSDETMYAKIEDCVKLAKETNIDLLAPAVGSVHGLYKGEPKLDFERMKEISQQIDIPLVLHGGTGISDEMIRKSIECGICKININTELQVTWATDIKKFLLENPKVYDLRKIIKAGEQAIKQSVTNKIILLGSQNRA